MEPRSWSCFGRSSWSSLWSLSSLPGNLAAQMGYCWHWRRCFPRDMTLKSGSFVVGFWKSLIACLNSPFHDFAATKTSNCSTMSCCFDPRGAWYGIDPGGLELVRKLRVWRPSQLTRSVAAVTTFTYIILYSHAIFNSILTNNNEISY